MGLMQFRDWNPSTIGRQGIMKVMIVDDNAEMRALIRSMLSDLAGDFVEFADGKEAVEAFEKERPDWTVIDVVMAEMDGLTATRLIRSRYPDSRILVITQHGNPYLRDRAREAGAVGFFMKEDLLELRQLVALP